MSAATATRNSTALRFDRADVLILDHNAANGETLRSYLRNLGIQKTKLVTTIADATAAGRERSWDIFFADISSQPNEVCALVRSMREGRLTENPFLHIFLLAWKLDSDVARQTATCGADELVMRPFAITLLEARLKALISNRPDFVVTGDYVGPDRRRDRTRQPSLKAFAAPNSLRDKCQPDFDPARASGALREHIQATCSMLDNERIRKCALAMSVQVSLLKEAFTAMDPLESGLEKLNAAASDLMDRSRNAGAGDVLDCAESILAAVIGAQSGVNVAGQIDSVGRLTGELFLTQNPGATRDTLKLAVQAERTALKTARAQG